MIDKITRAVIVVNPVSGSFSEEKINAVINVFQKKFSEVDTFYTKGKGDAIKIARKQIEERPDLIVAAGGDGTLNEVINGVVYSDIPLGFIPLGTANVLAKEFALPVDSRAAALKILESRPEYVGTGLVNNRHFIMAVGIGFDGEAVYRVNLNFKKKIGKIAYLLSGLAAFWNYNPEKLTICVDESFYEGYGLIVCNSKYYGGSFQVCTDASVKSPKLDLFIMHGKEKVDLVSAMIGILTGQHKKIKHITITSGKNISVVGQARIQIDGDAFCSTPAMIEMKPNSLLLCV